MNTSFFYSKIPLVLNLLIISISAISQSGQEELDRFMYSTLKTDSAKVNSINKVSFFVSENHKIFSDYKRQHSIDRNSLCSRIETNSKFPLSVVISCNKALKFTFYKVLVRDLKRLYSKVL